MRGQLPLARRRRDRLLPLGAGHRPAARAASRLPQQRAAQLGRARRRGALVGAGHRWWPWTPAATAASGKPHDPGLVRRGPAWPMTCPGCWTSSGAPVVDLVGYSMGAVVALIAAVRDARIGRLAIGGVGPRLVMELADDDRRAAQRRLLADALRVADPSAITIASARQFRTFADYVGGDRLALAAQAEALYSEPIPVHLITRPDAGPGRRRRPADPPGRGTGRRHAPRHPDDAAGRSPRRAGQRGLRGRPGRVLPPVLRPRGRRCPGQDVRAGGCPRRGCPDRNATSGSGVLPRRPPACWP